MMILALLLAAQEVERPNVVLFLADDLGARDLRVLGSSFYDTPHLDAMAREGMSFGRAYAACPVCSPTRASLLTGSGLSIGQPLPMGYSAYNVPLAYRDTYYDTPNAWYRYNNGYIYQVDPTTQLLTVLVRAIIYKTSNDGS